LAQSHAANDRCTPASVGDSLPGSGWLLAAAPDELLGDGEAEGLALEVGRGELVAPGVGRGVGVGVGLGLVSSDELTTSPCDFRDELDAFAVAVALLCGLPDDLAFGDTVALIEGVVVVTGVGVYAPTSST
jgi:hypothetical protein